MIWWWREDDLLGAKLASFVLLFGSPLDSRWPGVGSPGCGTVKTFLGEDATLLKLPVGVFRASSSSWCCCGMELCVLHSFSSHRMSCNCFCYYLQLELSLKCLAKYDTSCWMWRVQRVLFRLNFQCISRVGGDVNFRVCSAAVLVPGSTCSMVAVPCVISCCRVCVAVMDSWCSRVCGEFSWQTFWCYYCDHKLSQQGVNNHSDAKWWRYLFWTRILYY